MTYALEAACAYEVRLLRVSDLIADVIVRLLRVCDLVGDAIIRLLRVSDLGVRV